MTAQGSNVIVLDRNSPTGIAGVSRAHLPKVYARAKSDLKACSNFNEAQEFASKAEALAAYAAMKNDRELQNMAVAIRKRAERRYTELRRQYVQTGGDRKSKQYQGTKSKPQKNGVDLPNRTMRERGADYADVPADVFDKAVDANMPDKELRKIGTDARAAKRKVDVSKLPPTDPRSPHSKEATKLLNTFGEFLDRMETVNIKRALPGLTAAESKKLRSWSAKVSKKADQVSEKLDVA